MYSVQPCQYEQDGLPSISGFVIENNTCDGEQLLWINRFLHKKAMKSSGTCRQYAYRLCRFLNYLDNLGKSISDCADSDIVRYMRSLQYDLNTEVISLTQRLSPSALYAYYAPIRGLFLYLYESDYPIKVSIKMTECRHKDGYLKGIAPSLPRPDLVIDESYERGAPNKDYIRWYTEDQINAILYNFLTIRDKAIFSISLDGFRIDEILSSRAEDYDEKHGILKPYRSKRQPDGSERRSAPLSERSMKLLEDYLLEERGRVEAELFDMGRMPADNIFVNLRHGETFGQAMNYITFRQALKGAAKRAGLDPDKVRTHSGRSTRANEVLRDMAEHPERWKNTKQVKDIFGWKSDKSMEPYINRNDVRTNIAIAKKLREIDREKKKRVKKKNEGL